LADDAAPTVKQVNPGDGITAVGINAAITVEFSETMNVSTVNGTTLKLSAAGVPVNGRVEQVSGTVFTFIPDALLLPNTEHQERVVETVKDTAGNPMASAFTSTFVTAAGMDNYQPSVESVSPSDGTSDVPVTGSITIVFSESIGSCSNEFEQLLFDKGMVGTGAGYLVPFRWKYYCHFNTRGAPLRRELLLRSCH